MAEQRLNWVVETYSGAQTDNELIAAPTNGQRIVIKQYTISKDTIGTAFLEQGGNVAVSNVYYIAANDTVYFYGSRALAPNTSLTITTTGANNASVEIGYILE